MGKARSSRKGKKEWRRNISTADVDELVERTGREERSGGPLVSSANEELFFVDKSGNETILKKTEKHRSKVLHCDSVLQRASLVPPLPASNKRKLKDRDVAKPMQEKRSLPKNASKKRKESFDLWDIKVNCKSKGGKISRRHLPNVPAVEVDVSGCSYNPTYEAHQEALGLAVAEEMQHVYRKELQPEPIPMQVLGSAVEEEDMFFLEADEGDVDEDEDHEQEEDTSAARAVKIKRLTRAEQNKKARKRETMKEEEAKKERQRLRAQLQSLPEIAEDIELEEEQQKKLWIRRTTAKKERMASCPPRLGRHRFKPEPMQVLLREEVSGSLRKLKGCYSLLRERYKSLQRRGIVEPRVAVKKKARKMWVEYEVGSKGVKERQMYAALQTELLQARKKQNE